MAGKRDEEAGHFDAHFRKYVFAVLLGLPVAGGLGGGSMLSGIVETALQKQLDNIRLNNKIIHAKLDAICANEGLPCQQIELDILKQDKIDRARAGK